MRDDQGVGAELGQRGAPSWTVTMRVPARDQSYAAAKREIGPEPIDHRRETLNVDLSLHTMLQVLSVTPFEKIPLFQLFSDTAEDPNMPHNDNQLNLL
jgi:hypothetical protein